MNILSELPVMFRKLFPLLAISLSGVVILPVSDQVNALTPLTRGEVREVRNLVQLMPKNKPKRRAKLLDSLIPGDGLSTGRSSLADVRFNDGSLARVGEQAIFHFSPKTRNFTLNNGTVLLLIPPGRGRTNIRTPSAAAAIRGSALFVRYDQATDTTTVGALTNSGIEVSDKDGTNTQVLQAGQMMVVVKGRFERLYNFDLRNFYEISQIVRGLDLTRRQSRDVIIHKNPALDKVRAETSEALAKQSPITGAGTIQNPSFIKLTPTKDPEPTDEETTPATSVTSAPSVKPVETPKPAEPDKVPEKPIETPKPAEPDKVPEKPVETPKPAEPDKVPEKPVEAPKPAEPGKPPEKPVEAPKPAEPDKAPEKPVEAPKPTEPGKPPEKPVEAPKPAEPDKAPEKPVEAPKPAEPDKAPEKPVEAPKPAEPDKAPEKPVETPKPAEPSKPPEKPVETPKPAEPSKPPEKPVETPKPAEPSKPPEKPVEAPKPAEPSKPPEKPVEAPKPIDPGNTPPEKPVEVPKPIDPGNTPPEKPVEVPKPIDPGNTPPPSDALPPPESRPST
jgi:FecR protein